MKLYELFGDKGDEQIWRDNPGGKKIWVKNKTGKKFGPFSSKDNAHKFMITRKDIGIADIVFEEEKE